MKQILQSLKTGDTELVEVPCPQVKQGHLLIRTKASVVSAGTERMLVEFGKANILDKARQQPDKVMQVLDKIKTDGLIPTIQAVRAKLDQPIPLGYSNAGVVIAVGKGVKEFCVGDRVVSNGSHAEVVCVPENLCAKIPDSVSYEEAAFAVIGSIALQGIRLANPSLGECFVVTGLGLIGLLTVQLLKAQGCRVLGIDFDEYKLELAKKFGADIVNLSKGEDAVLAAKSFSRGYGVDGVIITASTKSSDPIHRAAEMCRKRGRIVLVGVTGMELSRSDFYEKELLFQVSCSYGPGRYDPMYEQKGLDYPIGFVRWTAQRNFEAVLDMLSSRKIDVKPLISHTFSLDEALEAYKLLAEKSPSLGILIKYPSREDDKLRERTVTLGTQAKDLNINNKRQVTVGVIGAGNFTNQVLLPALKKTGVRLKTIASSTGITGVHAGKRFGFDRATTDIKEIVQDDEIDAVFITTRHNTHAAFVIEALKAGKHVFVEKPLCLNKEELEHIKQVILPDKQILMVGFNRRFSPLTKKMKELINSMKSPMMMVMMVNAGYIPKDHWVHDIEVGGGRIVGEACHFIDLLRYLAGDEIVDIKASMMGDAPGIEIREDKVTFTLSFADGSVGTVHYFANGHKSFPKERLEVFVEGRILVLDNFKSLIGYGWQGFKKMKLLSQNKGHREGIKAFIDAVSTAKGYPIPLEELFEVTKASFDVLEKTYC
ncbi:bi-domain-containing oxidoreductase [Peptococcaceae bacterium]|nr:bi-domain-containing oxidoreductase [Peptococcaceae bacterium]